MEAVERGGGGADGDGQGGEHPLVLDAPGRRGQEGVSDLDNGVAQALEEPGQRRVWVEPEEGLVRLPGEDDLRDALHRRDERVVDPGAGLDSGVTDVEEEVHQGGVLFESEERIGALVVAGEQDAGDTLDPWDQGPGDPVPGGPGGLPDLEEEVNDPGILFEAEDLARAVELALSQDVPDTLNTGDEVVLDPVEGALGPRRDVPHEVRQGGFDLVNDAHRAGHEGGLEVAPGALNRLG